MKRNKFRHMGGGREPPSGLTPQRTAPVNSLVSFLRSCREEWDHVWKRNWASWSKKLNNSNAYKCHYLASIPNPDSRTWLSLSFKRTGQLLNQRVESSSFPLLGFWMVLRAPTAMATGDVENRTWNRGMERTLCRRQSRRDRRVLILKVDGKLVLCFILTLSSVAKILGTNVDRLWCHATLSLNASSVALAVWHLAGWLTSLSLCCGTIVWIISEDKSLGAWHLLDAR